MALSLQEVVSYFEGKGLSRAAAAGIAGNLKQESSLNPNDPGGGLAQWNVSRYDARGKSAQQQLDQIWRELSGSEIGTLHQLQRVKTPEEGARIFSNLFERPGTPMLGNREKYAREAASGKGGSPSFLEVLNPFNAGSIEKNAEEIGGKVAKPFEAIGSGLSATAKLATVVGEWIAEPLKPLKLIGGGVLIYMGLRTLTRTGVGGSVAHEVRYQAQPVAAVAAAPAKPIRRLRAKHNAKGKA